MFTNKKGRIRNGANDWKSFNLREYLSDGASKTDLYIFPLVVQKKAKTYNHSQGKKKCKQHEVGKAHRHKLKKGF